MKKRLLFMLLAGVCIMSFIACAGDGAIADREVSDDIVLATEETLFSLR